MLMNIKKYLHFVVNASKLRSVGAGLESDSDEETVSLLMDKTRRLTPTFLPSVLPPSGLSGMAVASAQQHTAQKKCETLSAPHPSLLKLLQPVHQ